MNLLHNMFTFCMKLRQTGIRRNLFLSCVFSGFVIFSGKGQQLSFWHLNVENGLSQLSVLSSAQDSAGFLWFGTANGLNRYDGSHFKVYINDPSVKRSLSSNYINALYCDRQKRLWVGTSGGLNLYDPVRDAFDHSQGHNDNSQGDGGKGLPSGLVFSIFQDSRGAMWIGTGDGLYFWNGSPGSPFLHYSRENLPGIFLSDTVRSFREGSNGQIWIGSAKGLIRVGLRQGAPDWSNIKIYLHEKDQPGSLSDDYVNTIAADQWGGLWIGTQRGGLNKYRPGSDDFIAFMHDEGSSGKVENQGIPNNSIRCIIRGWKGKLWIGTQLGLCQVDPADNSIHTFQADPEDPKSLSHNSIYTLLRDVRGTIWIGTYFGGINAADSIQTPFPVFKTSKSGKGISNNVVSSFAEDEHHNIYIGTEGGGLNYFDRRSGQFTSYQNTERDPRSLASNLVIAVYTDRDNHIWVGMVRGGLALFNPGDRHFVKVPLYDRKGIEILNTGVEALIEDGAGRLWIGTGKGLLISDNRKERFVIRPFPGVDGRIADLSVTALIKDQKGNIWIGTTTGMYIAATGDTMIRPTPITANIHCIHAGTDGNLWVGLNYGGLCRYDPLSRQSIVLTEKDGLPNNDVVGILEDSSAILWISTANGLSRFDSRTGSCKNYTSSDGLPGNGFNKHAFFKDSGGQLYFGGYNGFTSFRPDKIESNDFIAPLAFTSVRVFDKQVIIGDETGLLDQNLRYLKKISFRHDQNEFSIGFALLNYVKPEKNRYAYQLTGFDRNWIYTASPAANYTNLPAGNYTLLVRGANNDGIWGKPVALGIEILPPFWKTWWAYTIYLILAASLVFLFSRYLFIRAVLRNEAVLHQAKLNFFTNISHEIRTHLSLITGPVEKLLQGKIADRPEAPMEAETRVLQSVQKNSESLLQLVEELMDFRKAESGHLQLQVARLDIVAFTSRIFDLFQPLARNRNISTDLIHSASPLLLYFDKKQLEKVLSNLLSNAFKFTPDGGMISVIVREEAELVTIKVIDNGKGVDPGNLSKLFVNYFQENDYGGQNTGYGIGLALSKAIVELHKGFLTAESALGETDNRTCFTLGLKKGKGHFASDQLIPASPASYQHDEISEKTNKETLSLIERQTVSPAEPDGPGGHSDKEYSILVVEDNPDVRHFISESIGGSYKVIEADNGLAGWESATEYIPDLIISDVMMPEMDGFSLSKALKADQRTSHIPVILLTAKNSTESHLEGLQKGADVYLTKPFSIRVLEVQIRNLLLAGEKIRQKFSQEFVAGPRQTVINPMEDQFLDKLIGIIEGRIDDPGFGVTELSAEMAMSQSVLYKKLKALTDMPVVDFIKKIRLKKAAELLRQNDQTVADIAYSVGFSDSKYFSREFKKQFGMTPSKYAGNGIRSFRGPVPPS